MRVTLADFIDIGLERCVSRRARGDFGRQSGVNDQPRTGSDQFEFYRRQLDVRKIPRGKIERIGCHRYGPAGPMSPAGDTVAPVARTWPVAVSPV